MRPRQGYFTGNFTNYKIQRPTRTFNEVEVSRLIQDSFKPYLIFVYIWFLQIFIRFILSQTSSICVILSYTFPFLLFLMKYLSQTASVADLDLSGIGDSLDTLHLKLLHLPSDDNYSTLIGDLYFSHEGVTEFDFTYIASM